LLVDPGAAGSRPARLVVASGALDSSYFSDGTKQIAFAEVAADGVLGAWSTVEAPDAFLFDGAATIAAGSLYGFVTGQYTDRSTRALYGIPLSKLDASTTPNAFVRSQAWALDPGALSADEEDRLAGLCAQLVVVRENGALGTAPVDAAARVGTFRAGARFFGSSSSSAIAATPAGRSYVSGGFGSAEDGVAVRSTGPG
jgi:hypothetical protein